MTKLESFYQAKKIVVFGAGDARIPVIKYLQSIGKKVIFLSDNNPNLFGKILDSLEVISPEEIRKKIDSETGIVIASSYQKEIYIQLVEMVGIPEKNIYPYMTEMFLQQYGEEAYEETMPNIEMLMNCLCDDESKFYVENLVNFRRYLDPSMLLPNNKIIGFYEYAQEELKIKDECSILDCGAYTGDTAKVFMGRANNVRICAVEGMSKNFEELQAWVTTNNLNNIVPVKKFLGSNPGEVKMYYEDSGIDPRASSIVGKTPKKISEIIQVVTIDELFFKNQVKFDLIKIDVEGADLDVLNGGKNLIKKFLPKLMVASYHVLSHMWEIPKFIMDVNQGYKIYAGHHNKCVHEIELYCA